MQIGAEADQAVNGHADEEIDQNTRIHLKTLVLQGSREMREKGEVVDGVAKQYGYKVFEPAPGRRAEDFLLVRQGSVAPGGRLSRRTRSGAPAAENAVEQTTSACPKGGQPSY